MSAETLRRAAEEMRRDATNATPGRWKLWGMTVMADQDGTSNVDTAVEVAHTFRRDEHNKPRTWDAGYIAKMQPAVALAVADWLDATAGENDAEEDGALGFLNFISADAQAALTVARAYLGEGA